VGDVRKRHGLATWLSLALALLAAKGSAQPAEEWREPIGDPAPDPPEFDPATEARGPTLLRDIPDLRVQLLPPPYSFGFGLTAFAPFQYFGLGVELEVYATEWLRLNAVYSLGAGPGDEEAAISNYAEATLGLRVVGARSERVVEVVRKHEELPLDRPWGTPPPHKDVELRAWLPSYHAVFIEGGMLTGHVFLERCVANCGGSSADDELEPAGSQLYVPFAGLRYLYFVHATSQRWPGVSRSLLFQVYAHAIMKPLNEPAAGLLWAAGRPIERNSFGVRVGLEIPFCLLDCASVTFDGGYLSSPGAPMFSAGIKKRF